MIRLFFPLVVLIVLTTSCKKDYTCSCVQTNTTTAYTQYGKFYPQKTDANTFKNTYRTRKKDEAITSCKNNESFRMDTYGSGESQRTVTFDISCEVY